MRKYVAVVALALASCQDGTQPELVGAEHSLVRPRGTYVVVAPEAPEGGPRFGPGPAHRVVFMNRGGGTYTRSSNNDSSQNRSSVPETGTASVSAWSYGDSNWNQLMSCVRDIYAPFDITITDVDPGTTPHVESVVGGRPSQVGLPSYVGGVSPFTSDCSVIERSIVYTFSELYGPDIQAICETVAQETAHSFGLDHQLDCRDPMTYLEPCGPKSFQNEPANCGEDTARTCACGGSTQNSYAILRQVLGEADADTLPPTLSILRPTNGEVVAPAFEIEGTAADASGIESVTLFIDAAEWATDTTEPYVFTAPDTLAAGAHTIELRATDLRGNVTPQMVNVTVDDGTGDPGGPDPDPGSHGLGSPCAQADECDTGFCSGAGTCSMGCDPTTVGSCAAGFECAPYESGGGECLPTPNETFVGGCSVGGGPSSGLAALLLLGLALLLRRLR